MEYNGEVTGIWAVEGRILVVRRRVISVDEWRENGPKSVPQHRPTVTRSVVSRKSIYAPPFIAICMDGFHCINGLRNSAMFFL